MKNEYNFSEGEKGKFYHKDITLNIPIYLNEENYSSGLLAHEDFHAAKHVIESLYRGRLSEENCALLLERIVNDFTRWKNLGLPDSMPQDAP